MIGLIAEAVAPIAWVLCVGVALRRFAVLDDGLWRGLEWLSYWLLMPSLLISAIVTAPSIAVPWKALLGSLYGTLGLLTLVLLFGWRLHLFGAVYARFTSVYQGVIRFNTFISLALMAGLRPDLLPHLAIAAACVIVVINIACVGVMTAQADERLLRKVGLELARNPLILACMLGGLGRALGVPSGFPISGLALVGQAALPMGVLVLGAGLQWSAIRSGLGLTIFTACAQLIFKPLIFIGFVWVFSLDAEWALVGMLLMAVSTAPSSYILAKQLGGDAALMAGIVASQTLISILSLPVVLWVASYFSWIPLA